MINSVSFLVAIEAWLFLYGMFVLFSNVIEKELGIFFTLYRLADVGREDVFSDKKLGEFTTHVAPVLLNCEGQV